MIRSKTIALGKRVKLYAYVADELWYESLADGSRAYHVVHFGFYRHDNAPGVLVLSATVFGLNLRVSIRRK